MCGDLAFSETERSEDIRRICEECEVKCLYEKPRQGLVGEFTGISLSREAPEHPALSVNTAEITLVEQVMALLVDQRKSNVAEQAWARPPRNFPRRRLLHGVLAGVMCILTIVAGSALSREGGNASAGEAKPLYSQSKSWRLVTQLSDEFDGMVLDSAKWDNDVKDWGVWSWDPQNVWVGNGLLNLRMEYSAHRRGWQTLYYKSGIVKSRGPAIRYGYFEARIKAASRYPGVAPAFWAYRQEEREWTEIDFVELTQRRKDAKIIDTNLHVFRQASFPGTLPLQEERSWTAPWDPRDDFHVYGCEWDEKEIRWYVDGHQVQARRNDYWHQALDVVISFGVRGELKKTASPEGFPTTFQVDYVRVWSAS